jgi:hypothetical protein
MPEDSALPGSTGSMTGVENQVLRTMLCLRPMSRHDLVAGSEAEIKAEVRGEIKGEIE